VADALIKAENVMNRHGGELVMSQSQPVLPTNRAFLVQFHLSPTGLPSSYTGRVEHVVSGQMARFHSPEELLAFMIRVLNEIQEQSNAP